MSFLSLLQTPETVMDLEAAAEARLHSALECFPGRPQATVYLSGYVVEMTLKNAFYLLDGNPPSYLLTRAVRNLVRAKASQLGVMLPFGWEHGIETWIQLVEQSRLAVGKQVTPAVSAALQAATLVGLNWRVDMRYRNLLLSVDAAAEVLQAAMDVYFSLDSLRS